MKSFLLVALGGGLGAALRYAMTLLPLGGDFPVKTLLTNMLGAVLIGLVVGISGRIPALESEQTLFWKTGFCGGFTTFSTFSLEAVTLLETGKYLQGGAYILLSLGLCLTGVLAGKTLAGMIAA
ncbi:MAG: fluoride efflux transporter CrcB [Candidatus Onthomonas sp.]